MTRIGCLGFSLLLVVGCSDDGHVVGEMQTEGAGGTTTITATSGGGTANGDTAGSDGNASTTTASGTAASSGGSGADGGAGGTTSATTQSNSAGGTGAANGSGGSAGADASSGGTSGAAGETATATTSTTSTTGGDPCPPGEIWCPGCSPGEGICSVGGCPGVACPTCTEITTLEECEVADGCHAVFNDPETCGCLAIGCCARFAFCAQGSTANCEGPVTCASAAPYCSEPMYVPSYVNDCIEGCVRPEVCAD